MEWGEVAKSVKEWFSNLSKTGKLLFIIVALISLCCFVSSELASGRKRDRDWKSCLDELIKFDVYMRGPASPDLQAMEVAAIGPLPIPYSPNRRVSILTSFRDPRDPERLRPSNEYDHPDKRLTSVFPGVVTAYVKTILPSNHNPNTIRALDYAYDAPSAWVVPVPSDGTMVSAITKWLTAQRINSASARIAYLEICSPLHNESQSCRIEAIVRTANSELQQSGSFTTTRCSRKCIPDPVARLSSALRSQELCTVTPNTSADPNSTHRRILPKSRVIWNAIADLSLNEAIELIRGSVERATDIRIPSVFSKEKTEGKDQAPAKMPDGYVGKAFPKWHALALYLFVAYSLQLVAFARYAGTRQSRHGHLLREISYGAMMVVAFITVIPISIATLDLSSMGYWLHFLLVAATCIVAAVGWRWSR